MPKLTPLTAEEDAQLALRAKQYRTYRGLMVWAGSQHVHSFDRRH